MARSCLTRSDRTSFRRTKTDRKTDNELSDASLAESVEYGASSIKLTIGSVFERHVEVRD